MGTLKAISCMSSGQWAQHYSPMTNEVRVESKNVEEKERVVHEVSKKSLGKQFSVGAIIGLVYWGTVYCYIRRIGGLQDMLGLEGVYFDIIAVSVWIPFLELSSDLLPNFVARKLCHAGCGFGMLLLDSTDQRSRLFVYFVSAS